MEQFDGLQCFCKVNKLLYQSTKAFKDSSTKSNKVAQQLFSEYIITNYLGLEAAVGGGNTKR